VTTPASGERADRAPAAMTAERWQALNRILHDALDRAPAQRAAFVAEACGGDDDVRREVESLLAAHDRAGSEFLERPAAAAFAADSPAPLAERLARALEGRYLVEHELGRGGMATVHLARDVRHGRRVAIKVLREELAAAVGADRFLEEIRVTASLQHPHILPLFDSGTADGLLYYVMPFVEGETLRSRLAREGRLPVDVALQLAREMADGLEYAHRHGVVHRDVKPENVLLQSGHAMVADFGIALALEHAGGARLTHTGITLGTPQYMAPEQAAGEHAVDARTDVYALGAVLHEMLAGEPPFGASSQQAVLRRVMNELPAALPTRRADVPVWLDWTVRRALAKRPDDRFPSAAAFAAALGTPADSAEYRARESGSALPAPASRAPSWDTLSGGGGRRISARAAMYAAMAMLTLGLAGGWGLSRSAILARATSLAPWHSSPESEARAAAQVATSTSALTLAVLDRAGRAVRPIRADRPWTPRFSPDGRRLAYGAFGEGRHTSDIWITDLYAGDERRLTDDDEDNNDPQWSADGAKIAYSASSDGGKDLFVRRIAGEGSEVLATREGTQFASDWLRDGSALLVTEDGGPDAYDILVQPADGSTARPYAATPANETGARISPDGKWVAYTSDESGRAEVYLDSYPEPGRRVALSAGGGSYPAWRGDGRELYYWRDDALIAVKLAASVRGRAPAVEGRSVLFRAPYSPGPNTMYDVSPDGERFAIVLAKKTAK
jgi:serine/threonine-protein kinase